MAQMKVRRGSKLGASGDHELKAEFVREIARTHGGAGANSNRRCAHLRRHSARRIQDAAGDFRQFSVERLMRFLALRGRDVKIIVVQTKREPQITVTALAR